MTHSEGTEKVNMRLRPVRGAVVRRFLLTLALVCTFVTVPIFRDWPVVRLRAATLVNQVISGQVNISTGTTVNFPANTAAGNSIVVCIATGAQSTTLGVTANGGAITLVNRVENDGAGAGQGTAAVFSTHNIAGGFTDVEVTSSVSATGRIMAYQVSGLSNTPSVSTGTANTTGTSHTSSSSGLSATGFGCTASVFGNSRTPTAGGSWTLAAAGSQFAMGMYQTGMFTNDQGPFTHDSTSITTRSAMAVFADAVTSGCVGSRRTLMGAGC